MYGKPTEKVYRTFRATWRSAGGVIRVVLVREEAGRWVAFFSTDANASVAKILESVAARFSVETMFRDVKQVVGAGQQQVRKLATNVGAFHLCLWGFTRTEAWAWEQRPEELKDRTGSPWDVEARRPSHADKRRALRRELLRGEFQRVLESEPTPEKITACLERVLSLAG